MKTMEEKDIDLTEQAQPVQNEGENSTETAPAEEAAPREQRGSLKQ